MISSTSGLDFCDLRQWNDWFGEKQGTEAWETIRQEIETETQTSQIHDTTPTLHHL